MDGHLLWAMIAGALRDPILWVMAAVIGWSVNREVTRTIGLLATAGGVWGAIRAAVYMNLGEELGTATILLMIAICVILMAGIGLAVREVRWLMNKG
ncbi:MAG: hypothetical protein QF926_09335 [Alphaproteobacteria bacterium]|jgi:hypothetical protein|nr:hypothetical protein [Alphaproteobacteria bacterium]MDP6516807.1 hypothetical protein [Alphaproteobacteria bacterium]|tara:strand:+ start:117 stop:407 length:291 start_codon:yes stop_codon:yes gene_type:complete